MPPPATVCPRGKRAALGQRDQSFQEQAPGLSLRNPRPVVLSDFAEWKQYFRSTLSAMAALLRAGPLCSGGRPCTSPVGTQSQTDLPSPAFSSDLISPEGLDLPRGQGRHLRCPFLGSQAQCIGRDRKREMWEKRGQIAKEGTKGHQGESPLSGGPFTLQRKTCFF